MIEDLARAFGQLFSPPLRSVVLRSLALALALLLALIVAAWFLLDALVATGWPWVDTAVQWLGTGVAVVLAWLVYPAAATAVAGLFLDRVADAVERRFYPGLPPARSPGLAEGALAAVKLGLLTLALSLLVLPLYLVPGVNLAVFLLLNGYLLGREYFELVAARRLGSADTGAARRARRGAVFAAGVVIAGLFAVPGLNLAAPVLATAFMVHRVARFRFLREPDAR